MATLKPPFVDAIRTMDDMQRQGRMSHGERVILERVMTDRVLPEQPRACQAPDCYCARPCDSAPFWSPK